MEAPETKARHGHIILAFLETLLISDECVNRVIFFRFITLVP
jgi:hypothetical protein